MSSYHQHCSSAAEALAVVEENEESGWWSYGATFQCPDCDGWWAVAVNEYGNAWSGRGCCPRCPSKEE